MLCDSVFFKIWDEEANTNFIDNCGTSFNGKYRDITYILCLNVPSRKYNCTINGMDYFMTYKTRIGTSMTVPFQMSSVYIVIIKIRG